MAGPRGARAAHVARGAAAPPATGDRRAPQCAQWWSAPQRWESQSITL